jgi:hypothetical protein
MQVQALASSQCHWRRTICNRTKLVSQALWVRLIQKVCWALVYRLFY